MNPTCLILLCFKKQIVSKKLCDVCRIIKKKHCFFTSTWHFYVQILYSGKNESDEQTFMLPKTYLLLSEEKFDEDFLRLIYCGGFTNDSRIFSNVESRAARLNMFQTGKYSDVTLIADDGEIKAHRILLAAGSELMNAMLIGQ